MSWQLPDEAFRFLERRLSPEATVLELGSGDGTSRLVAKFAHVYSVEHDRSWVGRTTGATYIHAPIRDGWYDPDILARELPTEYDVLIVDGPPGAIGRLGMLRHLDLFKRVPVLVDDVNRPAEQRLLMGLVEAWCATSFSVHHLKGGRAFATFGWGDL